MGIGNPARLVARAGALGLLAAGGMAACVNPPPSTPPSAAPSTLDSATAAARCAELRGRRFDSGVVETAETVAAGATIAGGETAGAAPSTDICRVRLRLQPAAGSDIKVEIWLPQVWNNKLLGYGGAGFDGGLSPGTAPMLNKAVGEGYAVVANDAGHTPSPTSPLESWVHKQPERLVDFTYRANHLAAVSAKSVIAAYYKGVPQHAYFIGCSNGGRDGLVLASRYPDDYNGIVAGAPAANYVETVTQLVQYSQARSAPPGSPPLLAKKGLVHTAIMAKCDDLDGVKDGLLENPLQCNFDPGVLKCTSANGPACLTEAEVQAFRTVYGGLRSSSGEKIFSGPALGTEDAPDWDAWIDSPQNTMIGEEFYRWMVFDDPGFEIENYDYHRDYAVARNRLAPSLNASADLSAFTRRGGKLIIYQGWADPAVTGASTIKYYEDVQRKVGPAAAGQVRLFMAPGMGHCAGGPGPDSFDMQPVLERWVERGEAPERVIAAKRGSSEPFSRPLCAWPQTAHYSGSGSIRDATNFACKAPDNHFALRE